MRLMIVLGICLTLTASSINAAIVTASSQRDTLSIPFRVLDSLGNDVDLAAGDSLYVAVYSPGGHVVHKDSMAYNNASIVKAEWEDYAGPGQYALVAQVGTLTGGSSSLGVYSYLITVDDNSAADLTTTSTGFFQVVNSVFESSLDSAASVLVVASEALDSLEAMSIRLNEILDSVNAVLSTPVSASVTESDKQTIAGYVNDTLTARHGSGSWAASGFGSGAYATTIVAWDSTDGQPISGVAMAIYNLAQTSLKAVVSTDIDGRGAVNLDADTHIVVATAPGFSFPPYDTVVIAGSQSDTLYGCHFFPGFPGLPELCRVWGYVFDVGGHPLEGGRVTAYLPSGVARMNSLILTPTSVSTVIDSTGYFYLDLFPSALLQPAGTPYEFSITQDNGSILRRRMVVPTGVSWQLTW